MTQRLICVRCEKVEDLGKISNAFCEEADHEAKVAICTHNRVCTSP